MKKHSSSRSGLLLMEIIIAILFFSVVSAICLQLFVKAHNMGQDTEELDMAMRQCTSVAEILNHSKGSEERLRDIYTYSDIDNDGGYIYFDEKFRNCASEDSSYHLDIAVISDDEKLDTYEVALYANDEKECIYSLQITVYEQITH